MEDLELASMNEEILRDAALQNQRATKIINLAPLVCKGCECNPSEKECVDYKDCLSDYEKRVRAATRNGSFE